MRTAFSLGTAVNNHLFDLVKVQTRNALGDPVFDLLNNPVFNPERFEPSVTMAAKQAGSGISNLLLGGIVDQVHAGDGGLGAVGGSLSKITITHDANGFALHAGDGGGTSAALKGGAGGKVSAITVFGTPDGTPNSHFLITDKNGVPILDGAGQQTFREGMQITSGDGGGDATAVVGGDGVNISGLKVGFNASNLPSFDVTADSVHILAGQGGDGKAAGAGGAVTGTNIRISTANGLGDEVDVTGGDGGGGSGTGHDGAGGKVTGANISNTSTGLHGLTVVRGGDAGDNLAAGLVTKGAAGGAVKNLTLLGFDSSVIGGSGSNGSVGGAGGAISGVLVNSSDTVTLTTSRLHRARAGRVEKGRGSRRQYHHRYGVSLGFGVVFDQCGWSGRVRWQQ